MRSTVESILLRAREERLAAVTGAELREGATHPETKRRVLNRKRGARPATIAKMERAVELASQGLTASAIAQRTGVTERQVWRWWKGGGR